MADTPMERESVKTSAHTSPSSNLLAEALACVAWDGTVDVDRLVTIEFAHDEAAVRRVIDIAASFIRVTNPAGIGDGMTVGGSQVDDGWESHPLVVTPLGGKWRAITPVNVAAIVLSDAQLALYCGLCARHKQFAMTWAVSVTDMDKAGHRGVTPKEAGWCAEWRMMWMSRVANALAAESGAWTGDGVMRTQNLARTLLDILRARNAEGPLAASAPGDQASSDAAAPTGLREAAAIARGMPRGIEFATDDDPLPHSVDYDAVHAVALLQFVINATQRVYETQTLYTGVILPAEYDALQRNTPSGAFQ